MGGSKILAFLAVVPLSTYGGRFDLLVCIYLVSYSGVPDASPKRRAGSSSGGKSTKKGTPTTSECTTSLSLDGYGVRDPEDAPRILKGVMVVSVYGGYRDTLVWSPLAHMNNEAPPGTTLTLSTTDIKGVGFPTDHLVGRYYRARRRWEGVVGLQKLMM